MRVAFVPDSGDYEIVEGQGECRALRNERMCMLDLSGIKGVDLELLELVPAHSWLTAEAA